MATPRDLDPKYKKDVQMIVYRENVRDNNGVYTVKEHGPMPIEEWADYAKERGL